MNESLEEGIVTVEKGKQVVSEFITETLPSMTSDYFVLEMVNIHIKFLVSLVDSAIDLAINLDKIIDELKEQGQ